MDEVLLGLLGIIFLFSSGVLIGYYCGYNEAIEKQKQMMNEMYGKNQPISEEDEIKHQEEIEKSIGIFRKIYKDFYLKRDG